MFFWWISVMAAFAVLVESTTNVIFDPSTPEDKILELIQLSGITDSIIPALTQLEANFDAAVAAAAPCPSTPQYEGCKKCVSDKCGSRATAVCSPIHRPKALSLVNNYITHLLACRVVPKAPDLDASKAKADLAFFKAELVRSGGRHRRSEPTEPDCKDIVSSRDACSYYIGLCPCINVCPLYEDALVAKAAFEYAMDTFSDYNLLELIIDVNTFGNFDPSDESSFANGTATVIIGGQTIVVDVNSTNVPIVPIQIGPTIAKRAMEIVRQ